MAMEGKYKALPHGQGCQLDFMETFFMIDTQRVFPHIVE